METPICRKEFGRVVDSITARGPDGRGEVYFDDDRVALGHRRLAIVDLSAAAAQPMTNEDGRLWLTYNGEIYNHSALRQTLQRRGHQYRSRCDAETILHAYEEWGIDCVKRLRGIFAFAIWDTKDKSLFAARDHLGVKPFYYSQIKDCLAFCSQPKGLLCLHQYPGEPDIHGFIDYLSYGIVPEDRAAFKGMKKLPPAHMLWWRDGKLEETRYWRVETTRDIVDFEEAKTVVTEALEEAVRLQLMSDVPVGTYLSGGIDSSLITAIAAREYPDKIQSFTIGFHEKSSDERPYADIVVNHCQTKHHEKVLSRDEAFGLLDDLVEIYDEPYALGAAFPMIFLSRFTEQSNVKVVLAGDGADELFAGYRHYDDFEQMYSVRGLETANDHVSLWQRFVRAMRHGRFDPVDDYFPREGVMPRSIIRKLVPHDAFRLFGGDTRWRFRKYFNHDLPAVTAAQLLDLHTYLPDEILVKVDRATMAHGVEARVPFLDQKLVEVAFSISPEVHYRNNERKALLKAVAAKWLPRDVLTQRKKGFSAPLVQWLRKSYLNDQLVQQLEDGVLVSARLLRRDGLAARLRKLQPEYLWQLYLCERWALRWVFN